LMRLLGRPTRRGADSFAERKVRIVVIELDHHRVVGQTSPDHELHRAPSCGLISDLSQVAGEKIHRADFGCIRLDLLLNGHSTVRSRKSAPTANLIFRILLRACRSCRRFSSCGWPLHMFSKTLLLVLSFPFSVLGQAARIPSSSR